MTHRFQTFEESYLYGNAGGGAGVVQLQAVPAGTVAPLQESPSMPQAQEISTSESSTGSPHKGGGNRIKKSHSTGQQQQSSSSRRQVYQASVSMANGGSWNGDPYTSSPKRSSSNSNRGRSAGGATAGGGGGAGSGGDEASAFSEVPFDQRRDQGWQQGGRPSYVQPQLSPPRRPAAAGRGANANAFLRTSAPTNGNISRPFDEPGTGDTPDRSGPMNDSSDNVEECYHLQSDQQQYYQQQQQHPHHQHQHHHPAMGSREVHTDVEEAPPASLLAGGGDRVRRNYYSDHDDPYHSSLRMPPPRISDPVLFPYGAAADQQAAAGGGGGHGGGRAVSPRQRRQQPANDEDGEASLDVHYEDSTTGNNSVSSDPNAGGGGGGYGRNADVSYEEFGIVGGGGANYAAAAAAAAGHPSSLRMSSYSPPNKDGAGAAPATTMTTTEDDGDDNDGEDSLFDFDERDGKRYLRTGAAGGSRKPQSQSRAGAISKDNTRRSSRSSSKYKKKSRDDDIEAEEEEEDDCSYEVRVSLTERAQAAWKRKSARRYGSGKNGSNGNDQHRSRSPPTAGHAVSFNRDDTVHHFEPDETTDLDNNTLGGRSLNSEYTKSAESEVEDLIKDIFMIGSGRGSNPGRRKIKYSPHIKDKLRQQQQFEGGKPIDGGAVAIAPAAAFGGSGHGRSSLSGTDEETLETYEEEELDDEEFGESSVPSSTVRHGGGKQKRRRRTSAVSDTGSSDYYGGGGGDRGSNRMVVDEKKEGDEDDPLSSVWNYMEGGINAVSNVLGLDEGADPETGNRCGPANRPNCKSTKKSSSRDLSSKPQQPSDGKGGMQCFFQLASDVLLGAGSGSSCEVENPIIASGEGRDVLESAPSLEEDVRLVDLAIQAARSMHKLRGYEFDESHDVNIVSDIKFCVVDLNLPLGLIFQENETGCWVTKVLPNGNAIQTGLVEVGDQLAAVDGVSAIHMKVEHISKIIKRKSHDIELTFLRYVGQFRPAPGTIEEEGYEIKASDKAQKQATTRSFAAGAPGKKNVGFLNIKKVAMGSNMDAAGTAADTATKARSKSALSVRSPAPSTVTGNSRQQTAKTATSKDKKKGGFRLFGRRKTKANV